MDWESYLAELEGQFADDASAERAAVERESERRRLARLTLADRLRAVAADHAEVSVTTAGGHRVTGTVRIVGADWCGFDVGGGPSHCVRMAAISTATVSPRAMSRTLLSVPEEALAARATFGYVLRGWARKRTPVLVQFTDASIATGTIDRAGEDHCDLALHDAEAARRDGDVRTIVMVPFSAIASVVPLGGESIPVGG